MSEHPAVAQPGQRTRFGSGGSLVRIQPAGLLLGYEFKLPCVCECTHLVKRPACPAGEASSILVIRVSPNGEEASRQIAILESRVQFPLRAWVFRANGFPQNETDTWVGRLIGQVRWL